MNLTNCYSIEEKLLKQIDLKYLSEEQLIKLAKAAKSKFQNGILTDEEIVISALVQIIEELERRF